MLALFDALRDRGVTNMKATLECGSLECDIPPRAPNELPKTQEERERLMKDPRTPKEIIERMAEEDEQDLYAAS